MRWHGMERTVEINGEDGGNEESRKGRNSWNVSMLYCLATELHNKKLGVANIRHFT